MIWTLWGKQNRTMHIVCDICCNPFFRPWKGKGYLNHVYELCNLLQLKHDVSYIFVALIIMVVLLKCYLIPTQRHLVTCPPPTEFTFRQGLWQFQIKHNSPFSQWFQIVVWKNHHGSFSYCFAYALSQLRKEIFNLKNTFDNIPCTRDYVDRFSSLWSSLMGVLLLTNDSWGNSKRKT